MNILYGERDWVSSHARQTSTEDGIKSGHSNKIGIANSKGSRAVCHCRRRRDAKRSFQSLLLAPESRGPILVKWNVGHSTRRRAAEEEQKRFGQRR